MHILIRPVEERDIPALASIRARRQGTDSFWKERIARYLRGDYSPQQALPARTVFVAEEGGVVIGFAAGHKTRRLECDGELQWIDVAEEYRRHGVAAQLIAAVGNWFVEQKALRICVNVDPCNLPARQFYTKHGAVELNDQWMVWEDVQSMRIPSS